MSAAEAAAVEPVELQTIYVDASAIHPNDYNPNQQSEAVAKAERESIQRFGFIDPITVREHPEVAGEWVIIDGEHRWREAVALGYTRLPIVPLDVTELEAQKLTVILNETRGEADVVELGKLLARLKSSLDDEEFPLGLPFSQSELAHLTALHDAEWDTYEQTDDPDPVPTDDGDTMSELVLSYSASARAELEPWLKIVEQAKGTDGHSATVFEALRIAALVIHQGSEPPSVDE